MRYKIACDDTERDNFAPNYMTSRTPKGEHIGARHPIVRIHIISKWKSQFLDHCDNRRVGCSAVNVSQHY